MFDKIILFISVKRKSLGMQKNSLIDNVFKVLKKFGTFEIQKGCILNICKKKPNTILRTKWNVFCFKLFSENNQVLFWNEIKFLR